MSSVMRVPASVHEGSKRIAALQGVQPGDVLAQAWHEYLQNHRDEFAADLEEAARQLRDGTLEDLAKFASRNVEERAAAMRDSA